MSRQWTTAELLEMVATVFGPGPGFAALMTIVETEAGMLADVPLQGTAPAGTKRNGFRTVGYFTMLHDASGNGIISTTFARADGAPIITHDPVALGIAELRKLAPGPKPDGLKWAQVLASQPYVIGAVIVSEDGLGRTLVDLYHDPLLTLPEAIAVLQECANDLDAVPSADGEDDGGDKPPDDDRTN